MSFIVTVSCFGCIKGVCVCVCVRACVCVCFVNYLGQGYLPYSFLLRGFRCSNAIGSIKPASSVYGFEPSRAEPTPALKPFEGDGIKPLLRRPLAPRALSFCGLWACGLESVGFCSRGFCAQSGYWVCRCPAQNFTSAVGD